MTVLIRGHEAARLPRLSEARHATMSDCRDALPDPRIALLETEIELLRSELTNVRADSAKAEDSAYARGVANADDQQDRRLAAIGTGLDAALAGWNERLESLDALALALARTALGKMFDHHDDLGEFVGRTIARYLSQIDREVVIAIRVSAADFPDSAAIAALGDRSGAGQGVLTASAALGAGECIVDLRMGQVDLGTATLRHAFDAALRAIETAECVA